MRPASAVPARVRPPRTHRRVAAPRLAVLALLAAGTGFSGPARAVAFDDLFLFGDSYTDTGAFAGPAAGSTAGGYLARHLGIELVTSRTPDPGTRGVNFAESGARIAQAPPVGARHPRSLTQQVAEFRGYVRSGALRFDPGRTLFLLLGGLNDHAAPTGPLAAATLRQVAALHRLGGRYFLIALLPARIPAFADSAASLNPVIRQLVPRLQALYPDARIAASAWGPGFDDILRDPSAHGLLNTTDPGLDASTGRPMPACTDPDRYFYGLAAHPSDRVQRLVGARLYAEVLAIEPIRRASGER